MYITRVTTRTTALVLVAYSYYSWHAATAGSGVNITANNTDAPYSICPKGWKLPNTRSGIDGISDIRALLIALGGTELIGSYDYKTIPTGAKIYDMLSAPPISFLISGNYSNSLFGGGAGDYWTSASIGKDNAYRLWIMTQTIYAAGWANRSTGYPVRCLAR